MFISGSFIPLYKKSLVPLCFARNAFANSLFHTVGFVSYSVKYVSRSVVYVSHSVGQRICS